jgi:sulfatase maturation enzyme AslB (radical SAM superfamily)
MNIQSLSVVVPNKKCINDCAFCVSKMHTEDYPNMMDDNKPFYDLYLKDYLKRLEFARDNGCNTVMLTGNSEPQQNRNFLTYFGLFMMMLERPFRKIEMQTTGVLLDEPYLRFLRNHVGVNTISVSLSSLDSAMNAAYNGAPSGREIDIEDICGKIKKYDFNLRLSLNMTDSFDIWGPYTLFHKCKELGADQITFRVLYSSGGATPQDRWIEEHSIDNAVLEDYKRFIRGEGKALEVLEYGATKYSVHGMSVVMDDDCMATIPKQELKYLILRPDCKLYSKWDDPASLIF